MSNADVAFTYLRPVPARFRRKYADRRLARMRYSMSLFVIYFGADRRYEQMAHHEILMGPRYRGPVDDIFRRKHLPEDFSLYLHRPTATDPSLAPAGCDSWYVLSPVPHLGGPTDWTVRAQSYRDAIIRYLEERYLPGLSRHIVTERRIDPPHFRDTLNSHLGAPSRPSRSSRNPRGSARTTEARRSRTSISSGPGRTPAPDCRAS